MKALTEKQLHNRLNKYYIENYGDNYRDEWYINPKDNIWKFVRNNTTITLECDIYSGKITAKEEKIFNPRELM